MKSVLRSTLLAAACAAGLALSSATAAEPGFVDFGPALAGAASTKCVEVNLPEPLLNFAAVLAKEKDADAAAALPRNGFPPLQGDLQGGRSRNDGGDIRSALLARFLGDPFPPIALGGGVGRRLHAGNRAPGYEGDDAGYARLHRLPHDEVHLLAFRQGLEEHEGR